jgi:hypothetical protein
VTILRALAALAQTDETLRQGIDFTRRKVALLIAVVLVTLAAAMVGALWLSAALYIWITPDLGQAGAAVVTGLVFVVIAAIAILAIGGQFESSTATSDRPPGDDLVAMLQDGVRKEAERSPKPVWDLAAMLAVGVVAGLSDRRKP